MKPRDQVILLIAALAAFWASIYNMLAFANIGLVRDLQARGYHVSPEFETQNYIEAIQQATITGLVLWLSYMVVGLYLIPKYKDQTTPRQRQSYYILSLVPSIMVLFVTVVMFLLTRMQNQEQTILTLIVTASHALAGLFIIACFKWPVTRIRQK